MWTEPALKMWAAACRKRPLSDLFNTSDGSYSSTARKVVDNDRLRQVMGQKQNFTKALVTMIKTGKVTEGMDPSQWPTYAEMEGGEKKDMSPVHAWAAAGALGSMAASDQNHFSIAKAAGVKALCLLKISPCALGRVEAENALAVLDDDCLSVSSDENWAESIIKHAGMRGEKTPLKRHPDPRRKI